MPNILTNDNVWVRALVIEPGDEYEPRQRGKVVVVKSDNSECVVALENGINIRVPTRLLELRETHE